MAKIHPKATVDLPSLATSHNRKATKREVFTVWMKSLIMNSKGCTVFDSSGGIVYRVDNYDCERSSEVYLMDCGGKVVFTILKKVRKDHARKHRLKFSLQVSRVGMFVASISKLGNTLRRLL